MRSMILMGIIWVIYLFFLLPLYLIREKRYGKLRCVVFKLMLSGIFCLIGFISILRQSFEIFSIIIFLALLFSFLGDYYLVYIKADMDQFIKGILCFGMAHLFYILGMSIRVGLDFKEFLITAIIMLPCMVFKYKRKLNMGRADFLLTCYSVLVTFMAVKAVLMQFQGIYPTKDLLLFSSGAFLFWVSDTCLCVWRFLNSKSILSYVVSISYFTGQLMIATSVYFME